MISSLAKCLQGRRNGEVHAAATIRMGPSYGLSKDGRSKHKAAAAQAEATVEVRKIERRQDMTL